MWIVNFINIKLFIPLGVLLVSAQAGTPGAPTDWLVVFERWGIAGVWALVAYVLWKKQEKSDLARMELQREAHSDQLAHTKELQRLMAENVVTNLKVSESISSLARQVEQNKIVVGQKIDDLGNTLSE